MPLKHLFITAACLLLFAASGQAQNVIIGLRAPGETTPFTLEEIQQMPEFQRLNVAEQQQFLEDFSFERVGLSATGAGGFAIMDAAQLDLISICPSMDPTYRASIRGDFRSVWHGGVDMVMLEKALSNSDVRDAWGISEAQLEQMKDHIEASFDNMSDPFDDFYYPMVLKLMEEMEGTGAFLDGWERDAEIMARIQDYAERTSEMVGASMNNAIAEAMDAVLSPEQLQMIQESQLANIGEMFLFSPSIFEALGLTDEQREQMEQIRKELDPEFETVLDNWVDGYLALKGKVWEELRKEEDTQWRTWNIEIEEQLLAPGEFSIKEDGTKTMFESIEWGDDIDWESLMQIDSETLTAWTNKENATRQRLMLENPEFRRISDELQSQGRAFATRFKIAMFDVLTDEQWFRLQELIDNPPEHALVLRRALRELLGVSGENENVAGEEANEEASGVWIPGPGAWRPGDAIPEAYRMERNTRSQFPRGEE